MTTATTATFNGASEEAMRAAASIRPPFRICHTDVVSVGVTGRRAYRLVADEITGPALMGPMGTGNRVTVYFMDDGSAVTDPETIKWDDNSRGTPGRDSVITDLLAALARLT